MKLKLQQKAEIYCIKNGHAKYIWNCFGYIQCGRCGTQIGDRLGGYFDTTNYISVNHKCKLCNKLRKKLSDMDEVILKRLEDNKDSFYDYEKILKGIKLV